MNWILNFAFSTAASHAASFNVPEKFIYDLTWTGIKAGTASLELINDGDNIKIISTAQSARWVSVFYTVDDRAESTLIKNLSQPFVGQPVNYRLKIREGRHRRDKEVIFNLNNSRATYIAVRCQNFNGLYFHSISKAELIKIIEIHTANKPSIGSSPRYFKP